MSTLILQRNSESYGFNTAVVLKLNNNFRCEMKDFSISVQKSK